MGKRQIEEKVKVRSYTPISDALSDPRVFADTELSEGIQRHRLVNSFSAALPGQRRSDGEPLPNILCAILVWPILASSSIHSFCSELCQFIKGRLEGGQRKVDILYSVMRQEGVNWRKMSSELSKNVFSENDLGPAHKRAFVVDDSIKARRGKKVEGSSQHWDHTEGRAIQGHQVVELGMAGENGFLPVARQLFMGKKNPIEKPDDKGFKDKRSAAARDMKRAREETKHETFRRLLRDALKVGLTAKYILGDAWYGSKDNIRTAVDNGLEAIFQMKRGKMKYWLENPEENEKAKSYTAVELYKKSGRRMKKSSKNARYKTCRIEVWINLESKQNGAPKWRKVVLVFSALAKDTTHDTWVLFLSTELKSTAESVLMIYSLRWSIEVYFKEVKQNLGLLAEQSGAYQYAYASVHLAAMRYSLLFEAMLRNGFLSYGEIRDRQSGCLKMLSYAGLLWQLFRGLIEGAVEGLTGRLGEEVVGQVLAAIDGTVDDFLSRSLQLEPEHIAGQLRAESAGYL